jgi:probable phosphoglycerate mutase
MRLLLLARHGQSLFNVDHIVNGDPSRDRGLSPLGRQEAETLSRQVAGVAIDLVVVSQFPRAQQTARLALGSRVAPQEVDPELNDIRIGELEGRTVADYRVWKQAHERDDPLPGGESLSDAARRYADAFERVLEQPHETILCVCHEIPVRFLVNAAGGSNELDGPAHDISNATPYLFDEAALRRGVTRIRALLAAES